MRTNTALRHEETVAWDKSSLFRQRFLRDVLEGLKAPQKTLPCKYFYDDEGSRLFERICELPEYYVTRTETALLSNHAQAIAEACGAGVEVMEFGSGAGEKIRLLLNALESPRAYMPIDISCATLEESAAALQLDFPQLSIVSTCMDYTEESSWKRLPATGARRRIVFFPGSTIGNFTPQEAQGFLRRMSLAAGPAGAVLVGVDLQKDRETLERAYDDAAGVTAAFNLHLLERLRDELRINVPPHYFAHRACYNEELHRVEMHLVCAEDHAWQAAGQSIAFRRGETIHTENSYKYTVEGFRQLARAAGLFPRRLWVDDDALFSIHLLETEAR